MAAIIFPQNPSLNQSFTPAGSTVTYQWNGTYWQLATATVANSASFAASASYLTVTPESASYALTASYALNGGGGGTSNLQQVLNTGNGASNFGGNGSASIQLTNFSSNRTLYLNDNSYSTIRIVDNNDASNNLQIDLNTLSLDGVSHNWSDIVSGGSTTGSFTGSFTGSLLGSASYSITASYILGGATVDSASYSNYAETASYVNLARTASYVLGSNIQGTLTASISGTKAIFSQVTGGFSGSFTGSFRGDLTGLAQSALTAFLANTASLAVTASALRSLRQDLIITNGGSTVGAAITVSGSNTVGGNTYLDFLVAKNVSANALTPNKSLRLDNSGTLEVVNSAYTSTIFSLTDAGVLSVSQLRGFLDGTASFALTSSYSFVTQSSVFTASYVTGSGVDGIVSNARTSSFAFTSSYFSGSVDLAISASRAGSSSYSELADTASYVTASNVDGIVSNAYTASFITASNVDGIVNQAYTASFVANAITRGATSLTQFMSGTFGVTGALFNSGTHISATSTQINATGTPADVNKSVSLTHNISTGFLLLNRSYDLSSSANFAVGYNLVGMRASSGSNNTAITVLTSSILFSGSSTSTIESNLKFNSTASNADTASYIITAQTASFVDTALTASYVVTALTASFVTSSNIKGTVLSSSYVEPKAYFRGLYHGTYVESTSGTSIRRTNFVFSNVYTSSGNTKTVYTASVGTINIGPGTYKISLDVGGVGTPINSSTNDGEVIFCLTTASSGNPMASTNQFRPGYFSDLATYANYYNPVTNGQITVDTTAQLILFTSASNTVSSVGLGTGPRQVPWTRRGLELTIQEL